MITSPSKFEGLVMEPETLFTFVSIRICETEKCGMKNNNKGLTCMEVRQWDMVAYLNGLGFTPVRISKADYWYLSPLRSEMTPSFKINRNLNRWYDHGLGKGGNIIDFGVLYYQCTVGELLHKLGTGFSFQQHITSLVETIEQKITILGEEKITSKFLILYLKKRKIDLEIAERYCREVRYETNGKIYQAIGFKNDSGGYELRSPYFKGSSSPKDITTLKHGHYNVAVYEGFFDFLSDRTYYKILNRQDIDTVILNSLALFERARPFMEQHSSAIWLHLDRDQAGQNCSSYAQSLSEKYHDSSTLYKGYKDVNEWLIRKGYKDIHTSLYPDHLRYRRRHSAKNGFEL